MRNHRTGRKIVCVDLDGVLAQYDGWKGIDVFGQPIEGAMKFTKELAKTYDVVIYTTRCCEEANKDDWPPRKLSHDLRRRVQLWLDSHGFTYHGVYVGQGKPQAVAYIDDKGIGCEPQRYGILAFTEALDTLNKWKEEQE